MTSKVRLIAILLAVVISSIVTFYLTQTTLASSHRVKASHTTSHPHVVLCSPSLPGPYCDGVDPGTTTCQISNTYGPNSIDFNGNLVAYVTVYYDHDCNVWFTKVSNQDPLNSHTLLSCIQNLTHSYCTNGTPAPGATVPSLFLYDKNSSQILGIGIMIDLNNVSNVAHP